MVGESPIMKATMAGVKVNCLMDTGSQVSLISEGFFREHIQSAECNVIAANNWLTIRAVDGLEVPYVGYFETHIVISGVTVRNRAVLVVRAERRRAESSDEGIGLSCGDTDDVVEGGRGGRVVSTSRA